MSPTFQVPATTVYSKGPTFKICKKNSLYRRQTNSHTKRRGHKYRHTNNIGKTISCLKYIQWHPHKVSWLRPICKLKSDGRITTREDEVQDLVPSEVWTRPLYSLNHIGSQFLIKTRQFKYLNIFSNHFPFEICTGQPNTNAPSDFF